MKKNISRNPLWPDWYNGKKIDEVQFGRAFLEQWPLKCVNGTLYTLDGPVEDESEIKQRILENIEEYVTSGLSKKVTNILETIKLLAFSDPFPIEQECIHLQNGVYHLPDGSFQESRLFCQNRLPVRYDPKAASPDRWLTFLHELLDEADIPTLQEYLGYCLIPSTKGQKMMLIVGKGGEGKSRIGLVLKRLMGDAASNGSVQKVENNRFARADLERRLLMIDDDMDKLRPYHIEALYDTLSKTPCGQYVGGKRRDLSPKQQKRTLSGTTLHEVHQLLHNSFLLAVEPVLIRKKFLKWQDAHPEFPRIVFHGLRHSSATYQLMQSGGDFKSVQGNTGHATATVLMDTYAHTQDKPRLELTEKIEADFYSQDVAGAKPQEPPENKTPVATKITGKMILEAIRQMDAEERRELTRVLFA